MKSFKEIFEQSQQKSYRLGEVFSEGDWVRNADGQVGKIHRRGINYVIAITEEGEMFRAWVKDVTEHCGCFLSDDEPLKMRDGSDNVERAKEFINKYKKKSADDK